MNEKFTENIHVLDGSMAAALKEQGIDSTGELWTAQALSDNIEAVYDAHYSYLAAGAQMILTDTYQANLQAFEKAGHSKQQAENLVGMAVLVAQKARDDYEEQTGKHALVAASIGPYGAYLADGSEYRGDYLLNDAQYLNFHLPRFTAVLAQAPDCLALETQPKLSEPLALLRWLEKNVPQMPVYVSFTLRDEMTLSDGTELKRAVAAISKFEQVFAIGVNCIVPELVSGALKVMRQATTKKLIVYPNLGAQYDPETKTWAKSEQQLDFTQLTEKWYQAGARIIGGCCMTTSPQISQIATYFEQYQKENV
ncbi:homocysteine S-methyltransferase [Ligilactobacillus animalis]|uniref:homocysteine S-methyltransferase n=1 Tax=Ligilactobacillus animalis TaxID=1605 RepID=UPI0010A42BDA|nr:homocysteine S-methyltransferase [Ligilactobacillus animalis]MDO5883106.1 homocysteine S-methyltransferase [Ligilactobacillus animalis]MDU1486803.1 homocysteine S-methyltransferase [Ligilactobacillus animalis]MDU8987190.1 homocysteine S-methyltransferase [Ligilactobacillus animalis]THE22017.1 homocysteine methyltransferase [Ligilactobacillus animalis]THE22916.1 homocysteine methyltransferase [Ligilactobacillus animalis]